MTASVDAFVALRNPAVRGLAVARLSGVMGAQILNVTVGWQLYELTGSPFALGLVGLFELLPVLFFTIPAGNAADRYVRRNIAMAAQALFGVAAVGLALHAHFGGPLWVIYGLLVMVGTARAFSQSATATILPQILKKDALVNANAWMSSTFQMASVSGPAFGGLIIAATGTATAGYAIAALGQAVFIFAMLRVPAIAPPPQPRQRSLRDVFAGLAFIRRSRIFLAAITLDMFAVLFGGAVALLPVFAKDILQVGPDGLGWLRAAPSLGSMSMALVMTRLPPWKKPGRVLLVTVVGFGLATVGFALSRDFALSLGFLFLVGAFDAVSVVIRVTLEQMVTPDALRGRVSAVGFVFIGFSNEFGAFWNGSTATLFGPVLAVTGGGIGAIAVVMTVAVIWPELRRIGPLHTLKPQEEEALETAVEARKPAV